MEDHEDQYNEIVPGQTRFSDPPQPPKNQDEPVQTNPPFISPQETAKAFMQDVRIHFLKLLTTEQAFQLLADLNRDLNEALAREIEEQTSKVSEAQQKLDRLSGLKYNLINR